MHLLSILDWEFHLTFARAISSYMSPPFQILPKIQMHERAPIPQFESYKNEQIGVGIDISSAWLPGKLESDYLYIFQLLFQH